MDQMYDELALMQAKLKNNRGKDDDKHLGSIMGIPAKGLIAALRLVSCVEQKLEEAELLPQAWLLVTCNLHDSLAEGC